MILVAVVVKILISRSAKTVHSYNDEPVPAFFNRSKLLTNCAKIMKKVETETNKPGCQLNQLVESEHLVDLLAVSQMMVIGFK